MENKETKKPIVLVGMMGAGKTHIGRMLASHMELEFYDSDKIIEEKAGMSIPHIFERFGEEKFRSSEHKTILELIKSQPCVIATGGGAVKNPETLAALKADAVSIWIDAPLDLVWERVKDCTHRPLLKTEDPQGRMQEIYEARKDLYAQAHHHIINEDAQASVGQIIKLLSE